MTAPNSGTIRTDGESSIEVTPSGRANVRSSPIILPTFRDAKVESGKQAQPAAEPFAWLAGRGENVVLISTEKTTAIPTDNASSPPEVDRTDSNDLASLKKNFVSNSLSFQKELKDAQLALKTDLKFGFDKSSIDPGDPKSKAAIQKLAETIKKLDQLPGMSTQVFTIEGHTDSKGSISYNNALSKRRAEEVKQALIDLGVKPERLAIVGKGESRPIAKNTINGKDNPEGRAKNRRAEVGFSMTEAEVSTYTKKIEKWFDKEIEKG